MQETIGLGTHTVLTWRENVSILREPWILSLNLCLFWVKDGLSGCLHSKVLAVLGSGKRGR